MKCVAAVISSARVNRVKCCQILRICGILRKSFSRRNGSRTMRLTAITHNPPESITATKAYIETMFLVKKKTPIPLIKNYITTKYEYDLSKSIDEIRPNYNKFYCSCKNSVPQAIICALNATSYEDAIRNAVSLGGDSDTLACMAGGIAELRFEIPEPIRKQACQRIDNNILSIIRTFYQKTRS